jgi:hypothetical protein
MYLKAIETNADIVVSDILSFTSGSKTTIPGIIDFCSDIKLNLLRSSPTACNKLYKRKLFENIKYPVGKIYEDFGTTPYVIKIAKNIVYLEKEFYFYRAKREDSITNTVNDKIFDIISISEELIKYFSKDSRYTNTINDVCIEKTVNNLVLSFRLEKTKTQKFYNEMLELFAQISDWHKYDYFKKENFTLPVYIFMKLLRFKSIMNTLIKTGIIHRIL